MNERTDEQTEAAGAGAEAKGKEGASAAEVSLGKFKDARSLLAAYRSLEAEFTRRSTRLRELEGRLAAADKAAAPAAAGEGERRAEAECAAPFAARMMSGGAAVAAPPMRPRTISEAGELARGMLEK